MAVRGIAIASGQSIPSPTFTGTVTFPDGSTWKSGTAFSATGADLSKPARTLTDSTTGAGTVASTADNFFGATTFATAANAITITNAYGTYFSDPVAGTNVTLTAKWALGADSANIGGAQISAAGSILAVQSSALGWQNRSRLFSSGDGLIRLSNGGGTSFTRLNFGGDTSSFAAFQTSGTTITVGLADGTAGGTLAISSGGVLKLGNAATTGLTPGVLAASTNASIVLTDSAGQAYRIPCII